MRKNYKVLHAPTTVGGNPSGLSNALKKLEIFSESLTLYQNQYNYPVDHVLFSSKDSFFKKELKRLLYIVFFACKYDVIHYNYGTTLATPLPPSQASNADQGFIRRTFGYIYSYYTLVIQFFELNFLKVLGKKLFVTYQGDDARQGDYSLKHFKFSIASQVDSSYYSQESDAFKAYLIRRLDRYCEQIYSVNPDLLHVLPARAKFIPYSHVFMEDWTPHYTQLDNRSLRIGHAPSHRKVKGTNLILEALERLAAQGHDFEFILVEGMSYAEAKKIYETVDVLIDQIFAGWYGGLAVEAMALGKPVIVYIRDGDLKYIPKEMADDLPFIQANPENLAEKLLRVIEMPRTELLTLAKKSRAYVQKWHDPLRIATTIQQDYELASGQQGCDKF